MRDKDSESLLGQHDHVVNRLDNPELYIFLCSIFETFSRICGKTIHLLLCLPKSLYYLSGSTLPLTYGQWVRGVMCYFQLEKLDIQLKCTPENSMPLNNHLYRFVIGMEATSIIIWPMSMFLWVVFHSACFYLLSLIVLNFVYDNPWKERIYVTISHYTCIFLYGCLAKNTLMIQYLGKGDGQELVFNCPLFKLYLFLWYVLKIIKDPDKLTFSSFFKWDLTEQLFQKWMTMILWTFFLCFLPFFSDTTNTHYPLYWVHLASNRFDPLLPSELH